MKELIKEYLETIKNINDLYRFLTSAEAKMFIQGDVKELKHLPCLRSR